MVDLLIFIWSLMSCLCWNLQQMDFCKVLTCETGGQPYNNTSPYKEAEYYSRYKPSFVRFNLANQTKVLKWYGREMLLCQADMGEINRGGLPDLDLNFSKSRGGLPDLDLDPTRFLSRYYPPRDISPISGAKHCKMIFRPGPWEVALTCGSPDRQIQDYRWSLLRHCEAWEWE